MVKKIVLLCIGAFGSLALQAEPVTAERFIGTWIATVEYNRSFDTYEITFSTGNRCNVKVSNDRSEQEASGNWSWDGAFFRLNALFRNAKIPYQHTIQWASVLAFAEGADAFYIMGKPAVNSPQMRFTFIKQDSFEQDALAQTYDALSQYIPDRSRIAVVAIAASDPDEGAFFLDELTFRFVSGRKYIVVDRRDIEAALAEQNFQTSGYVDDESAVSIGKFLGANVVITGSVSRYGSRKRLVVKALDVQTAEILSMSSVSL
jgi:TolB-like protein